jgi:hypothetical protein
VAYTPLDSTRLKALPLVLAGPILRRTEPGSVTVWVALKEPRTVTLRVYSAAASGAPSSRFAGSRGTVSLGEHLHVVAVTARTSDAAKRLAPGALGYYNLFFGLQSGGEVPADAARLGTPGILSIEGGAAAQALIAYPPHPLPSFVVPPASVDDLRIVHGSCRKPHGEGRDALAVLDRLIAASPLPDSTPRRPSQLFLTGDQIYADDVPIPMLKVLTQVGNFLLGSKMKPEVLPLDANASARADEPPLLPGSRQKFIDPKGASGMSSEAADSHLMALGEFYAMYLLVWSDVLWPAELPRAAELFPEQEADWQLKRKEYERKLEDWMATWGETRRAKPSLPRRPTQLTKVEEQEKLLWDPEGRPGQRRDFRASIPAVRRALANVSTYMSFDDHEITDDWYLNKGWCLDVLSKPLGRRIIRNGLLAFAVFQSWGNDPDQFDGPVGTKLLDALGSWDGDEGKTTGFPSCPSSRRRTRPVATESCCGADDCSALHRRGPSPRVPGASSSRGAASICSRKKSHARAPTSNALTNTRVGSMDPPTSGSGAGKVLGAVRAPAACDTTCSNRGARD